jgi:hypothetical protein
MTLHTSHRVRRVDFKPPLSFAPAVWFNERVLRKRAAVRRLQPRVRSAGEQAPIRGDYGCAAAKA